MTTINSELKSFSTDAFHNGKFIKVSSQDVKGKWAVFFFYPADFTFVCPTELEDLADNYATFRELGVEIYAVSTDKHFTHKAWHDTSPAIGKIRYVMLADPTGAISRNFGVLVEDAGVANRGTFLIDPQGRVQYMEITAEGVGRTAESLIDKIKAAQYIAAHPGEVCPAKWKEDGATLTPSLDLIGKI
ncbi:alkyl hydroperoxide reductase subunit C [Gluconacetobacter diazotrophicus]|uniref:alkyl hydroperoxide reductase subunit C n=1 Tax=Gluconacetobacter diazotrophicus TaxID=33996 RepID=UPI00119B49EF|nr:alkyl hydroperoxide reductase subunit C [Gluconacetobacter diazotrophicus]TWB08520.1 peroxiredoxin (alkyl hydroperoxide reductase subunit C) [Gluconacetobacter diazotrophicus]